MGKSARMRTYEDAFMWLVDAKVVNPCYNATDPTVGMALSSDCATQKLYMGDTGLLMTLALGETAAVDGELYKAIFTGDVYFNKGMIAENAVAQALVASGRNLYFYSRAASESRRTEMEIDFLIRLTCPYSCDIDAWINYCKNCRRARSQFVRIDAEVAQNI